MIRANASDQRIDSGKAQDRGTGRFTVDPSGESSRGSDEGAAVDLICQEAEGATGSGGAEGVPDEWNCDIKLRHLTHLPLVT